MGQSIGYARVSTIDQTVETQIEALQAAGCSRIFSETASGARSDREQLRSLVEYVRPGDTVVVWKLDRLGRSLRDLLGMLKHFEENEIAFRSLTESWDTNSAAGKILIAVIGAFAEYELTAIRERTAAGRARSMKRPGPKPLISIAKLDVARQMLDGGATISSTCEVIGVSRSTLYRALERVA